MILAVNHGGSFLTFLVLCGLIASNFAGFILFVGMVVLKRRNSWLAATAKLTIFACIATAAMELAEFGVITGWVFALLLIPLILGVAARSWCAGDRKNSPHDLDRIEPVRVQQDSQR